MKFGSGRIGVLLVLLGATGCQAHHEVAGRPSGVPVISTSAGMCRQMGSVPAPAANVRGLSEVSAPAEDDVWALGFFNTGQEAGPSGEFATHWDGRAWHTTRLRVPEGGVLNGIAAINSHDVWIVGDGAAGQPTIQHWNGRAWSTVPAGGHGVLNAVTALSASDVWAVGATGAGTNGKTLIEHWSGSRWNVVPSPSPPPSPITAHPGAILDAISAASPTDIWAVGERGNYIPVGPSNTLTEHWDGIRWRVVPSPTVKSPTGKPYDHLLDVTATHSGVWAVGSHSGNVGTGGGPEHALLLHWNGSRWLIQDPPRSRQADILWSTTTAAGSLWVGGQRDITKMLVAQQRRDRWSAAPVPSSKGYLAATTGTPDGRSVWIVGVTVKHRPMALRCNTSARRRSSSDSPASFPPPQPTQLPTTPAVSVQRIGVGYGAYDIAAGAGSVWVAVAHGVTQVDPRTGRVGGHVPVANSLEWTNVAAAADSVWYLGGDGRRVVVRQIDPATLRVRHIVPVGISNGYNAFEGVAGTSDGICVGVLASHPPGAATCIGPGVQNGRMAISTAGAEIGGPPMVAAGVQTVVLGGGAIRRVNLHTGAVTTIPIPGGAFAGAVANDGVRVWAILARLHRRAQLWGILGSRVVIRRNLPLTGIRALAAHDGRVWILAGSHIYAVTPAGQVRPIATVSATSRGLAATTTALWTAQYQAGTVTRISFR